MWVETALAYITDCGDRPYKDKMKSACVAPLDLWVCGGGVHWPELRFKMLSNCVLWGFGVGRGNPKLDEPPGVEGRF
jgi:hypothetical protein